MGLDSSIHHRRISRSRRRGKSLLFFERLEDRLLLTVADLFGGVSPDHATSFVPGEIIVKFDSGGEARASEAAQLLDGYTPGSWQARRSLQAGAGAAPWARVKLDEGADVLEVARQLSQLDGVAYAEPNYLVSIDLIPNDASFSSLWGMHNTGQTGGTVDADIDAPEAWETQTGSLQSVVGVIDSGIDYRHPDLFKNIWLNQGEIPATIKSSLIDVDSDSLFTFVDLNDGTNWLPGNANSVVTDLNGNGFIDGGDLLADPDWVDGIDADGNSYLDDLVGWDFVNNDNDPFDDHAHGTHVSGTIGGMANNSVGVAGVNWQVQLMGLKFLDSGGGGSATGAVDAIYYAIAAGANLTNNSWGGGGYSQAIYDAIAASGDADMLFVAAAGNNGIDNDGLEFYRNYPSSYDLDNIIAVAATDHNDQYADFTNYGASMVDLAAPGVSTLSTTPNNTYSSFSGTSMATPHVAGAAALLLSENPNLSSNAIKQALLNSVDPVSGNPQSTLTNGRLNLFQALNSFEDDTIPPAAVTDLATTGSTMTTVGLSWSATGDDGLTGIAAAYDVRYAMSPITETNWAAASQAVGEPSPQASGSTENFVVANLVQNTGYYFALKVRDNVGNESGISNVVLASTSAGTVVFEDDMESGPGTWVATGLWHQSSHRSNSPTNAWYYGQESVWNYDTGSLANSGTLTSQTIDLSTTNEAFFSFSEWSEVEAGTAYDRTRVQLSSDGNSWTTVFESHGTNNTWAQRQIDLANYVGGTVQLRYDFDTIDQVSNNFEGWYIDDVKVVAASSGPGINVTPTSGLQTNEAGGQASFNIVLTAAPTNDVTIGISSSDPTEGTASPAQLVFTTTDWNQPKTVVVTGLDDPESPTFVDGDVTYTIVTAPASSSDLGYANLDASDVSVTNLDFDTVPFQIEHGVITVPASGSTIQLDNTYVAPVVITTPNYGQGDVPAVVRLDNVGNDSFDIHVVSPTGAALDGVRVHYVVVEQGTYTLPGGVQLEASTFDSSVVDGKSSWTGHARNFENSYQNPVVLGQVMSSNDRDWSVFWSASASTRTAPPSGSSFVAGLHVGEDPDTTRVSETIGYLVLDSGSGELDGIAFESGVGADIVQGMDNAPPYTYSLSSLTAPDTAIVSQVAMDGNDGSWALLYGDTPLGISAIQIAADEDQLSDTERSHTTEQAAYLVLKDTGPPLPTVSIGDAQVTEGDSGTVVIADFTVTLSATPDQPVTVNFATGDSSATSPADYTGQSGSLTFAAGTSTLTQTISIVVNGDAVDEFDETYSVTLGNPTNATIADGSGTGTILDDDPETSLSINDVSVTEGNSGTTNATFTVTLAAVSGKTVTVDYATANGSATAGQDYAATAGTLTISAGSPSGTITVPVIGDTLDEIDETYSVTLSSPTNATITDGSGAGTILDDDAPPSLSIDDVSVTEGNGGTTNATFTVSLSAISGQDVTIDYATFDGTATAGQDYASTAGTLTITAGNPSGTITVQVSGDTVVEGDETFDVILANPINASVADDSGTGTILDDDIPTLTIDDVSVTEGNSGTTNATFTVSISAISGQDVTVDYATANGSATAGQDYAATAGTLTIAAGNPSGTITVPVIGDTLDEINETYSLTLSGPTNALIADGSGAGTILDDDAPPSLSIDDVSVAEGNGGTTNATFTVTLSAVSGQDVTVDYATANGSATAGQDYAATTGTLTIAAGNPSGTITVQVIGDTLDEINETYSVTLSSPANATIADGSGAGTILDDDAPPSLSIDDVSVAEGNGGTTNATFTVTLSAVSGQDVTVDYATANGSATAGQDYAAKAGTLTIAAGNPSGTITVQVIGDTDVEGNETFDVNLSNPANASLADGAGTGTILDDDVPQPTGRKLYVTLENSVGNWQSVALPQSYTDMVVVGTPNYDELTDAAVVRVRQAAGNSFSFMVQRTNDGAALSDIPVHFLVIEAGVYPYDANTGTPAMEAVKYSSTVTDRAGSWKAEPRSYQQSYFAPVVVGQVMSDNDANWSVFWSRGGSKNSPPSNSVLRTGKHVGEDYNKSRADETIGYVVMDTGYAFNGTYTFTANVGSDTVLGMQNAPPYSYTNHPYYTSIVIASQAGMDGNDGGWPVLYGSNPVTPDAVHLAIDEDTIKDSERRHTSEQVAFLAFTLPFGAASLVTETPARLHLGDPSYAGLISDESLTLPVPVRSGGPESVADSLNRVPAADSIKNDISMPATSAFRDDVAQLFGKLDEASPEEWNSELFGELNSQDTAPWDELMFDDLAKPARRR